MKMATLVIAVECVELSDAEFLRYMALAHIEELVEKEEQENRLKGNVEVNWEIE